MKHCVYKCFDNEDVLLYIGATSSFQKRMAFHNSRSNWYGYVARIEIKLYDNRIIAFEEEEKAIKNEHPRFNAIHNFKVLFHNDLKRHTCEKKEKVKDMEIEVNKKEVQKISREDRVNKNKQLYFDLLSKYDNSPLKVAYALDIVSGEDEKKIRDKARSRVGMWAHNGVSNAFADKASELLES